MRVIVTGWRHADQQHARIVIDAFGDLDVSRYPGPDVVVHGDADGLDRLAAGIARELGWAVEAHPARWDECGEGCPPRPHLLRRRDGQTYCPYAGPRRNEVMCRRGADLLLAFPGPGSRGTWDCVRRAAAHGIACRAYPLAAEQKVGAR